MKLYVHKNPDSLTRALVREMPDDAPAAQTPWEEMTVEDFNAWRDAQPPIERPPVPEPVPEFVRSAQLRQWLIDNDKMAAVTAAFENQANFPDAKTHQKALARWDYEVNVRRDDSLVAAMSAILGMSSEEVDAAFIIAAQIP